MNPDYSKLDAARSDAEGARASAVDFAASGATLADELRKAVGERFAQSPIAQEAATARSEFLSAAPQARSDVAKMVNDGTILSPSQQQAILASRKASALAPVMGSNILQEAAFGTMNDLINAGTHAYSAEATRKQGLAELAQKSYSDLLSELVTRATQERAAAEEARSAELFPLQKKKLLADIAGGGTTTSKQLTTIGDKVYNYNPKTGQLEQIKGVNPSKYNETDIANFANGVADGSMKITSVPQEIRGSVQTLSDQIKASKPNILQSFLGMFGIK